MDVIMGRLKKYESFFFFWVLYYTYRMCQMSGQKEC